MDAMITRGDTREEKPARAYNSNTMPQALPAGATSSSAYINGQLDFVGGGPQLRATKLLNEAPREVNGNHEVAISRARLVLIRNEVNNVTDV